MTVRIIILPTAYPNPYNSYTSIFVQDQVTALKRYHDNTLDMEVVGAIPISLKDVLRTKRFSFGLRRSVHHGIRVTLFLFPAIPKLRRVNNAIRYLLNKKLLKYYTKERGTPDLIHVHNVVAAAAALWYRQRYHVPYCITEHSSAFGRHLLTPYELSSYQTLYRHATYNIAVSQKLSHDLHHLSSKVFKYIPNVIHTDFFLPPTHRTPSSTFTFINVAYLNDNKNHLLLIEAFAALCATHTAIHLHIVGSGSLYNRLQEKIRELQMHEQITLHGFATRDTVLDLLQHADAFVLSSHYETFGVAIIEAMSCGLPVISTKCGGPESIIINDTLGILVDNRHEALVDGMQTIMQSNYNRDAIRAYVIQNFSEKIIGEKLVSLYNKTTRKTAQIASFVFNPFTHDSRVLKEALTLHEANYDVTVVAHGDKGLKTNNIFHGIHITRLAYLDRKITKSTLTKLWAYFNYVRLSISYGKTFDVLHCHDLNTLPIGVIIKLLYNQNAKVVYDAHEYETEVNNLGNIQKKIARIAEKVLIQYADSVITVSDGIAREYERLYNIPKPALVLNAPIFQEINKQNRFRETLKIPQESTIFLYQGNLSHGRGIEILLETFQQIKQKSLVIVFMGYGSLEHSIQHASQTYENIYFHEAVSPDVLLAYTSSADFGISTIEDSCLSYRYCLPNKIFEYLMANIPVVVSNLPEMRKIVNNNHIGVVAETNTPEGLETALLKAVTLDSDILQENIQRVKRQYHWGVQENVLLKLYRKLDLHNGSHDGEKT